MKRNQRAELEIFTNLDGTCGDVAVVGETRGKGRSVIKCELWLTLRQLQLLVKRVDFSPVCENFFLLGWEVWFIGH